MTRFREDKDDALLKFLKGMICFALIMACISETHDLINTVRGVIIGLFVCLAFVRIVWPAMRELAYRFGDRIADMYDDDDDDGGIELKKR